MNPIKIGITGGIGSGKSVVARLLECMGIPVYISDDEAKGLMLSDDLIRRQLIGLLGKEVYSDTGLNKPLLAAYLFGDPHHAERVNSIVHPRVKAHFLQWAATRPKATPIVGIESAILIEAGFTDAVDAVVMVDAPLEVRIARAMKRDRSSRQQVEQRIRRQMDNKQKRRQADYVIVNDDNTPLIPQVLALCTSFVR
ncbi:MAG: dephospho-CoA kinase [Bacteroides sp.]|nr:dephospho-CoA kinase [Bacteroides sp.]